MTDSSYPLSTPELQGYYLDSSGLYTDGKGRYKNANGEDVSYSPQQKPSPAANGLDYGQQQSSVETSPQPQPQAQQESVTQVSNTGDKPQMGDNTMKGGQYGGKAGAAMGLAQDTYNQVQYNNSPEKEIAENAEKLSNNEVIKDDIKTENLRQAYKAPGDADEFIHINSRFRGPGKGLIRVAAGGLQQASRGKKLKAEDLYTLYTGGYNNMDQAAANDIARYNEMENFKTGGPLRKWMTARGILV